jgi:hypothetical protein
LRERPLRSMASLALGLRLPHHASIRIALFTKAAALCKDGQRHEKTAAKHAAASCYNAKLAPRAFNHREEGFPSLAGLAATYSSKS